jgi:hypothetical protein
MATTEDGYEIMETAGTPNTAIEAVNRAEIDIQISTAHRFPRHMERAQARMKAMVCKSPDIAGECFYVLPRGGKRIEGPSVRLAEVIAINYGNIRVVTRQPIVGDDEVTVEWAAHDLESNYATSGTVSTAIRKTPKAGQPKGERYNADMINVACLSTTAKARRNGIFAIVPGTIVKELLADARKVVSGGDRPIEAKRELAMAYFRKMGIDDARILAAVNRSAVEQLSVDDLADLHGFATAIREGHATIDETFPGPKKTEAGSSKLADKLKPPAKTEPPQDTPNHFADADEMVMDVSTRLDIDPGAAEVRCKAVAFDLHKTTLAKATPEELASIFAAVTAQ